MKKAYALALMVLMFMSGTIIANLGEPRSYVVGWGIVATMWLWSGGFLALGYAAGKDAK